MIAGIVFSLFTYNWKLEWKEQFSYKNHHLIFFFQQQQTNKESISRSIDNDEIHSAYLDRFTDDVQSIFGKDSRRLLMRRLKEISNLLFGRQIEELTLEELRNSWQLVGQDELIVMSIHQDMDSFPKLLGKNKSHFRLLPI